MEVAAGDVRISILRDIEGIVEDCVSCIALRTPPTLSFRNSDRWGNVSFETGVGLTLSSDANHADVNMGTANSIRKFGKMLKVLNIIYFNVQNSSHCSKRDIFYQDPKLFGRQTALDKIMNNIGVMLQVPRANLNVHSSGKGLAAGSLQFREPDGNLIDCSAFPSGIPIPQFLSGATELKSSAKFVLIVEKDASFQKILEDDFIAKYGPCIVLTGKGFPDQGTRTLAKLLWERFHLPSFCLVDADPHGVEIMSIYKYGSMSLCHESKRLAVPGIQWLGVLPSDIERLHISKKIMIPMTTTDIRKAMNLLRRESIRCHCDWIKEIHLMIDTKSKAEMQCLDSIAPKFLVDVYLPNKLKSCMDL